MRGSEAQDAKQHALHAAKGLLYEEPKRLARMARAVVPMESALDAVSTRLRAHARGRTKTPKKPGAAAPAATTT